MPIPVEDLEGQALQLPVDQRGRLVESLLRSLASDEEVNVDEVARQWDQEIVRRAAELDAGHADPLSYEDVRAELRAMIRARTR